jgi:hypothetical protein
MVDAANAVEKLLELAGEKLQSSRVTNNCIK